MTVALARTSDPDTSRAAASSLRDLNTKQQHVLRVLRQTRVTTDAGLVGLYQVEARHGRVTPQSDSGIRSRRAELVRRGLVRDTGLRAVLPSGRKAIVWQRVA